MTSRHNTERALMAELTRRVDRSLVVIATAVVSGALASVAALAMWFHNGPVFAWTAIPAVAGLTLACCIAEFEPDAHDDSGKGEVSTLSFEEFERLVDEVERSAAAKPAQPPAKLDPFEQLVRDALDELPPFLQTSLSDNVAVVVSDDGAERGHYGLYHGGTVVYGYSHTILIYRDTLVRDFGHDPDELRRQVAITVRHEAAHHLGASERRVADLGL